MAVAIPHQTLGSPARLPRRAAWALWGSLAAGAVLTGGGALTYLWPREALGRGDAGAVGDYPVGTVRYFAGLADATDAARRSGY